MHCVLYLLARAIAPEDISSLELESLLHSALEFKRRDRPDVKGIFVSRHANVPHEAYQRLLEEEKYAQDFRYLAEFGILRVEIAPSGTPFSIQRLTIPTDEWIQGSVTHLQESVQVAKTILRKGNQESLTFSEEDAEDMCAAITAFSGEKRINAVRRIDEIAYILHRARELEQRFRGPHAIDGQDTVRAYANA